ncbi:MAG: type II/IV secretion system protein, partial [Hyphomicrobiales bacterium]|nr:type II/IV secretion system protein [Hyphomicrobiales bacterium]
MKSSGDALSPVLEVESEQHALVSFLRRNRADSREGDSAAGAAGARSRISLRQLWEASDVSAHDLADEVALRYRLPRLSLNDLMQTRALCASFSARFLRDAAVFPYEGADGVQRLAMADPGERAVLRAVAIELGEAPEIVVASFDDIAAALGQRIGETGAVEGSAVSNAAVEETVENL